MAPLWTRSLFGRKTARIRNRVAKRSALNFVTLEDRVVPTISVGIDSPYNNAFTIVEGNSVTVTGKLFDDNLSATDTSLVLSGIVAPAGVSVGSVSYGSPITNVGLGIRTRTYSFNLTAVDGITNTPTTPPESKFAIVGQNDKGDTSADTNVRPRLQNFTPVVTAPTNQFAIVGKAMNIDLGSFVDPGADANWTVSADLDGNGTFETTFTKSAAGSIGKVAFTYVIGDVGTKVASIKVTDKDGAISSIQTFNVNVASKVATTYVDDTSTPFGLTSPQAGDLIVDADQTTPGDQPAIYGYDAWNTITDAVGVTTSSGPIGTVNVNPGTYQENLTLTSSVNLVGPNLVAGSGTRTAEAIIQAPTNANAVIQTNANNISIRGFTIDGDAAVVGASVYSGHDVNATYGVTNNGGPAISGLIVQDNIIANVAIGVRGQGPGVGVGISSGNVIDSNLFRDIGVYDFGYGVTLRDNFYADVTNNVMRRVWTGIHVNNFSGTGGTPPASWKITGNDIQSYADGAWLNQAYSGATSLTFDANTFAPATTLFSGANPAPVTNNIGVLITGGPGYTGGTFTNTTISNQAYGLVIYGTTPAVTFGNTNTLSGNSVGVYVTDSVGFNPIGTTNLNAALYNSAVILDGLSISGSTSKAIWVKQTGSGLTSTATLQNSVGITGGATGTGIVLDGANATLGGNTLSSTIFTGFSGTSNYVLLTNTAYAGSTIIGTAAKYNGILGGAGLTPVQGSAIEDRIVHAVDDKSVGFVETRANTIYVNALGTSATIPTATRNDFTVLANAVTLTTTGKTTYLAGTFDWTETNAAASWALGNDATASSDDDYSLLVPGNRNSITFTAASLGAATIQGPGDVAAVNLEGPFYFPGGNNANDDNQNLTISNLQIYDFDLGIGMFNSGAGVDAFNGTTITNNIIRVPTDRNATDAPADTNQNIGIHYSFGQNQTISNNTINFVSGGLSDSANNNLSSLVGIQSNTSGGNVYDGLMITGNTMNVLNAQSSDPESIRGIYENGFANSSNITVSNNTFNNLALGNNPVLNREVAFRVTSHSSATTTVTYSGNIVNGANIGFLWQPSSDFTGALPVKLTGNTITNSQTAVLLQSNGSATLSNNTLSNTGAMSKVGTGVSVAAGSTANIVDTVNNNVITGFATGVLVNGTATITGNDGSFTGNTIAIDVSGGTATITGNAIDNNTTGIRFTTGGTGSVTGNDFDDSTDNSTDLLLTPTAGTVTIGAANQFAGDTFFIDNQTTQSFDLTGANAQIYDESNNFRIEDKIHHRLDTDLAPTNGLITWVSDNVYVTQPGLSSTDSSIQRGIDAVPDASTGWTVNVESGTYDESVNINEDVTLLGSGKSSTNIQPSTTGTNNAVVTVSSPGVTIDGFELSVIQPTNLYGIYANGDGSTVWTNLLAQNNTIISAGSPNSASRGIFAQDNGPSFNSSLTIRANSITAGVGSAFWRGIETIQAKNVTIGGTSPSDANTIGKTAVLDVRLAFSASSGTNLIQNNTFNGGGVEATEPNGNASVTISNNAFTPLVDGYRQSLFVNHNYTGATVAVSNNTFTVRNQGEAVGRPGVGVFVGGSAGTTLSGNTFNAISGATNFVYLLVDTQQREGSDGVQFGDDVPDSLTATGNTFNGSDVVGGRAIAFYNGNSTRVVTGTVSGSQYGSYVLGGAGALANSFAGKLNQFIQYNSTRNPIFPLNVGPTVPGPVTLNLDATGNQFDVGSGLQLPSTMTLADKYTLEGKLVHKPDSNALGLITVVANNIYVPAVTNTIQNGIDAVPNGSSGWTVNVDAGTFAETVTVDEKINLIGSNVGIGVGKGDTGTRSAETIITPNVNLSAGSLNSGLALVNVTVSNVTIDGFTIDGDNTGFVSGFDVAGASTDSDAARGILVAGPSAISNVNIQNNYIRNFTSRGVQYGLRSTENDTKFGPLAPESTATGSVSHSTISGIGDPLSDGYAVLSYYSAPAVSSNIVSDAYYGVFYQFPNFGLVGSQVTVSNNAVTVEGLGIGLNAVTNAGSVTVSGNAVTTTGGDSLGVQLTNIPSGVATISGNTLTNTATGSKAGSQGYYVWAGGVVSALTITGGSVTGYETGVVGTNENWGFGASTQALALTLDNVALNTLAGGSGVNIKDTVDSSNTVTVSFTNGTTITGTTSGTGVVISGPDAKVGSPTGNGSFGNAIFTGFTGTSNYLVLSNGAYNGAANGSDPIINASTATFNGTLVSTIDPTTGLGRVLAYGIEDKIVDQLDDSAQGYVQLVANKAFATAASPTGVIQRAINAEGITTGGTVYVQGGTYSEDLALNLNGLSLLGEGAVSTTVSGPIGGSGSTMAVLANNVTISGFKITRDGNNTTDWNNAGLNTGGITVQGQSITNLTAENNIITGNRTGIDINNSNGHTIRNNDITFNRTGMIMRNQTDNLLVTENNITDNWTVGILFLDGSNGSNTPVQQAFNSQFFNNNISGNWYGGIVDRQSGGVLPVPGTTKLKDFSGNWFGSNNPTFSNVNSSEPGYAGQIPVAYGGSASNPGGAVDVLGPASANIDFSPYLWTSTDTDGGAIGFQGDFDFLGVIVDGAQIQSGGRINEAIGYNGGSATDVNVRSGSYLEAVDLNRDALTVRSQGAVIANSLQSTVGADRKVDVNGNSFTYGDTNNLTFNGVFVGSGSIVKQGTGKSTLTGDSLGYTGSFAVNAGTLNLNTSTTKLGGTVTVGTSGTLTGVGEITGLLTNNGTVSPGNSAGILTAKGGYTQSSSGTLVVEYTGSNGNASPVAGTDYDQLDVTGAVSLAGTLSFNGAGNAPANFQGLTFIKNDAVDAITGGFNGKAGGTVYDFGGGNLYLVTYAGGTGNDFVLLKVAAAGALEKVYTDDSWTGLTGGTPVTTPDGTSFIGYDAFADLSSGISKLALNGLLSVFNGSYGTATFNVAGATLRLRTNPQYASPANVTFSGALNVGSLTILDLNRLPLTVAGGSFDAKVIGVGSTSSLTNSAGTLTLNNQANSYKGSTTVTGGTLALGTDEVIPDGSPVAVNGGSLNLSGFVETIGSLEGTGGGVNFGTGGELDTGSNNRSTTFAGVISGTGSLVKEGVGTLALSGNGNTITNLTINVGTVQLGAGGNTGATTTAVVNVSAGASLAFKHSDVGSQDAWLGTGSTITGDGSVIQNGTGGISLSAGNTYTGGTTINSGTLMVGDDSGLGDSDGLVTINNAGTMQFTNDVESGRTFNISPAGSLSVSYHKTLMLTKGSAINGGSIRGSGDLSGMEISLNATTISTTGKVTVDKSTLTSVINNGSLSVAGGVSTATGFANSLSGNLVITGTMSVDGFSSAGYTQVSGGGLLKNLGTSELFFTSGRLNIGVDSSNTAIGFAGGTEADRIARGQVDIGVGLSAFAGTVIRNNGNFYSNTGFAFITIYAGATGYYGAGPDQGLDATGGSVSTTGDGGYNSGGF